MRAEKLINKLQARKKMMIAIAVAAVVVAEAAVDYAVRKRSKNK